MHREHVYIIIILICPKHKFMHTCTIISQCTAQHYRNAKSIKEAVELACHEDPKQHDLKWYLAMTDSIVDTIQCADPGSTTHLCKQLDKVNWYT